MPPAFNELSLAMTVMLGRRSSSVHPQDVMTADLEHKGMGAERREPDVSLQHRGSSSALAKTRIK